MDFIKKNWGLLLYSLGCLILAGFIGFRIKVAASLAEENRDKLDEQLSWFETVKKENVKLNQDNERVAQDNRDRTEEKFEEMRRTLATKYSIDPRHPATEVEAVRQLQNEIHQMNTRLEQAELDYTSVPYLSFRERAVSTELPNMQDVPRIFRQLRIVQEVVRIVAQSDLDSVDAIERPMGLEVIEEDLYTATPIRLIVTGTTPAVQEFINRMTEANYLFFLRKLSMESADQAPSGALGASASLGSIGGRGGGMAGEMGMEGGMPGGDMGMEPGGGMPGGMGRPRRPGGRGMPGGDPGEAGMMEAMGGEMGMPGEMGMAEPGMGGAQGRRGEDTRPMSREDLRAFVRDRPVRAELRFDVIEFNKPEEEAE